MFQVDGQLTGAVGFELVAAARKVAHLFKIGGSAQIIEPPSQ